MNFDHPAYGGIYHQCVYMLCHQDDATMRAGQLSKEAFSQGQTSSYMPHLSLLYSDIDEHVRSVSCWGGCELMHNVQAATATGSTASWLEVKSGMYSARSQYKPAVLWKALSHSGCGQSSVFARSMPIVLLRCGHDVAALPAIKVTRFRLVFLSASQLCQWVMREFLFAGNKLWRW